MIQANELRIGNFIMDRGNKIWQVDYWESSNKVAAKELIIGYCDFTKKPIFGHPLTEEVDFLKPVPLTNEWFNKLGVSSYGREKWLPVTNLKAELHFEVFTREMHGTEIVSTIKSQFCQLILDPIKYVHQLQNL